MIVLDTHVLVWFVSNPEKLSQKVQKIINREIDKGERVLISSISVWEIYMLVKKGRISLSLDLDVWLQRIEQLSFIKFVSVDNKIAAKSVTLPEPFNSDPADRMIIATSREYGAKLITSDKKILNYSHVQSVW